MTIVMMMLQAFVVCCVAHHLLLCMVMFFHREYQRVQGELKAERMRMMQLEAELKAKDEEQGRLRKVGGSE